MRSFECTSWANYSVKNHDIPEVASRKCLCQSNHSHVGILYLNSLNVDNLLPEETCSNSVQNL